MFKGDSWFLSFKKNENCVLQDEFRKYESTLQRKEIEFGVKY